MQEIKPIFTRKQILVEDDSGVEKIVNGIVIPYYASEDPYQAKEVLIAGAKCEDYKVGDTVYFKRVVGEKIELFGKKYIMFDEGHIFCKLEGYVAD